MNGRRVAVAGVVAAAAVTLAPMGAALRAQQAPTRDTASGAPSDLQRRVAALLRERGGPGTRFGLVVATVDGREIVAIAPEDRYIPASNTKMFTTAAAFARLGDTAGPDMATGATVRLEGGTAPTVVLAGHGDARLSSAADCATDCLSTLADAVAARTRVVGDVVGDDSYFPDERWGPGWSWNNLQARYGTAVSALTLDDNEVPVVVHGGERAGAATRIDASGYFTIQDRTATGPGRESNLDFLRLPGSDTVRVSGTVAAGAEQTLRLGVSDPAHYAAWQLRRMLVARGVRVRGDVRVRHRPLGPADPAGARVQPVTAPVPLARAVPGPLIDDLTHTSKVSQNLHAELLLRRLGRVNGDGATARGLGVVGEMLDQAGVPRWSYDFADGSGMSTYNRVTPRYVVRFLRWVADQPWGAAWRGTLPVGGVDGTLASRFRGTPLEGRVFAKTGSLNATNALSGYLTAASGQTLIFSSYANDVPEDAPPATAAVDAALAMIAAAN